MKNRIILLCLVAMIFMGQGVVLAQQKKTTPKKTKPADKPAPKAYVLLAVSEKTGSEVKGEIIKSVDNGTTWKIVYQNFKSPVNSVVYGTDKWVAVAGTKIYVSPSGDEDTWVENDISGMLQGRIKSIAYGGGFFVAGGEKGTIVYSKDTKIWNPINDISDRVNTYYSIKYFNNKFIVAGNFNRIITLNISGDKVVLNKAFKNSDDPKDYLSSIACSNKIYICHKAFFRSADGETFNQFMTSPAMTLSGIGCGNGIIIGANADGGLFTSSDGTKWEAITGIETATANSIIISDIVFFSNSFIAVGSKGTIWKSTDGKAWSPVTTTNDFSTDTFLNIASN